MKKIILAALSGVVALPAFAQTAPKPDGAWRGSIGVGATAASGNTKSLNFSGNADAVRQTKTDKLGFYLQSLYGRSTIGGATTTTANQLRLGGRYDRDFTDRIFGFGGLDLEKNKLANIKLRTVPSVGVGYHVIKSEQTTFDVFGGLAYNHTDRYTGANFRGAELLLGEESTHKISSTTSARQRFVVYPSLKDSGEYRSTFDAGIVTAIVGGWNLTATLGHRYDSNPPAGVKKSDLLLFTGLQYGWGPK